MALNFPANPKRGDIITAGERKWKYTGTTWIRVDRANQGARGIPGATGSAGATGATGATGPVEEFVASINGLTGDIITSGLTFAFEGITVGVSGISIDGAVSFTGTTGEIRKDSGSIDIKIGGVDFTLARFATTNLIATIGDANQASNGTRIEVNQKLNKVDVHAGSGLELHDATLLAGNGISLGVGLTFPDGSFQSSAHAPHEFVASFNGATGAIEGVNSFNGATGAIVGVNSFNGLTGAVSTTDLSLQVKGISASVGITFADGSFQNTAAERGYQYTVSSTSLVDTPGSGQCVIDDVSGIVHSIKLHATDADGNDLSSLFEYFRKVGGNIKYSSLDGKTVGQAHSDYTDTVRTFGSTVLTLTLSGSSLAFILEEPSVGDTLYFTIEPNDVDMVNSLGGFTGAIQVQEGIEVVDVTGIKIFRQDKSFTKNTATFTISASSAIATGQKTDSLHRFPYDATITGIDVKVNGSGGFTAGAIIAGPDFGNPTTSSLTGGTLGIAGTTGSITGGFNNTSVTAGGFMFFDVVSNGSGSTQAQMFVSYERR